MSRLPASIPRLGALAILALTGGCLERPLVEVNPCLIQQVQESIDTEGVERVDLLFVIDDSGSMEAEQALLREQFRRMIDLLTSGQRPNGETFEPIKDLHVGVVSTDMGASPVVPGDKCDLPGKDGLLQINPSDDDALQCGPLNLQQPFLRYQEGDDATALARNFQCIATLGTEGCGYEQQLEAMLKAVSPAPGRVALPTPELQFFGANRQLTYGHGADRNAGFLRGLDGSEDSIIAVVLVTDEEDCSAREPDFFDMFNEAQDRRNVLCDDAAREGKLFPIERYVEGLRALRPNHPERVIFAAIVGLPDALDPVHQGIDFTDDDQREAYYDNLLTNLNPTQVDKGDGMGLVIDSVCTGGEGGLYDDATPPPRIVQVARGFGEYGLVHSICSDDFRPALEAVVDRIADAIPQVCLTFPLVPDATGRVNACQIQWQLPAEPLPGELRSCDELPFLHTPENPDNRVSDRGRPICVVDQVPVLGGQRQAGQGWYYDDFSAETAQNCRTGRQRRIAFTDPPGPNVKVTLACAREGSVGEDLSMGARGEMAHIGSACVGTGGQPDDSLCLVRRADGNTDARMRCHPNDNVCVLPCASNADCPAAWVCDTRQTDFTAPTGPVCVNPTCGD